jgi:integrase
MLPKPDLSKREDDGSDPMAPARAKRRAMRAGGRSVGYDRMVITPHGGKYRCRVRDPYRRKYVSSYQPSRSAAEKWGRDTLRGLTSRKITSDRPTLGAAAKRYLAGLAKEGKSSSTQRLVALACAKAVVEGLDDLMMPEYRRHVTDWLAELKADTEVNPAVHNLMAEWLPDLMEPIPADAPPAKVRRIGALTLSASTRNTYLRCITAVVKTAAAEGEFMNPLPRLKKGDAFKVSKVGKPVFTPPELRALLADARRDHPAWLPVALLTYTGCRIDECLHLRWGDIDFAGNSVAVRLDTGARVKGAKERSFPLQPELRTILEAEGAKRWGELWKERAHGPIIAEDRFRRRKKNGDLDRTFYDAMRSLCTAAKVAIIDRRSPHSFRHTHAALRVATGESPFRIQGDLGHESDTMTRAYSREERSLRGHVAGWPADGTLYLLREPPRPAKPVTSAGQGVA